MKKICLNKLNVQTFAFHKWSVDEFQSCFGDFGSEGLGRVVFFPEFCLFYISL